MQHTQVVTGLTTTAMQCETEANSSTISLNLTADTKIERLVLYTLMNYEYKPLM